MDLVETYRRSFILSAHGAIPPYLPLLTYRVVSLVTFESYHRRHGRHGFGDRPDLTEYAKSRFGKTFSSAYSNSFPEMLFYRELTLRFALV